MDFIGQDPLVGDYVAYPGRTGASLWMNMARVVSIDGETIKCKRQNGNKVFQLQCWERAILLEESMVPEDMRIPL